MPNSIRQGTTEVQGTPADIQNSHIDFFELLGVVEKAEDRQAREMLIRQKSKRLLSRSSTLLSCDDFEFGSVDETKNGGIANELSSKGIVKGNLIINYFKAGIHWSQMLMLTFSFLFVQLLVCSVDYFVSIWTKQERIRAENSGNSAPVLSTQSCILIQTGLVVALIIFIVSRTLGYYSAAIRVARNVHYMMFNGMIRTSKRFFDTNPSGRILNRFSRDLR